jgi:hypothetical protein
MTRKTNRFRLTIASLMAFVAAFALFCALILPLLRQKQPPCLSMAGTARWLLTKPGAASCKDCHAGFTVANRVTAPLPPATAPKSCAISSGQGSNSCVACHAMKLSSVSGTAAQFLERDVQ